MRRDAQAVELYRAAATAENLEDFLTFRALTQAEARVAARFAALAHKLAQEVEAS